MFEQLCLVPSYPYLLEGNCGFYKAGDFYQEFCKLQSSQILSFGFHIRYDF